MLTTIEKLLFLVVLYRRRHQVLMENSFPHELQSGCRGMERNGNPWNLSRRERMKWAGDLAIPTVGVAVKDVTVKDVALKDVADLIAESLGE